MHFRLLQLIIPCNKWLNTTKIKYSDKCNCYDSADDIAHFLIDCPKVIKFRNYWINWWETISGLEIKKNPILHECILFGYLNSNPEQKENNTCSQLLHFIHKILYLHSEITKKKKN